MRQLRHILLAVSLSACLPRDRATMPTAVAPAVPPPLAAPRPPIVELPGSRVGRFARRSLDLVDGGDTATRRAFFEQHLTSRTLVLGSLDDWLHCVDALAIGLDDDDLTHGVAHQLVAHLAAQEVG